jgi:hypothetical protein
VFKTRLWKLLLELWRLAMVREPKVSFSMRELDRLKCIQAVIDVELKIWRAAIVGG